MSYKSAGVDIEKADLFVDQLQKLTRATLNKKVKSAVAGYASLYALNARQYIAASTDGVGTKLKLAFQSGKHDTVGIDLVAMSVNDLICVGATPLFFLDYFATGKLEPQTGLEVLKGIVAGCKQAGCALVGGETAEMPGFYSEGEYDLAGFAVGIVDQKRALPKKKISAGAVLIGLPSSGIHSNGYSMVRKLLTENSAGPDLIAKCLEPTRIYVRAVKKLIDQDLILGMAHITGSGILNLPRISTEVDYQIEMPRMEERAEIFSWLVEKSAMGADELYKTFNMGIGMILVCDPKKARKVIAVLKSQKEKFWVLGKTAKKKQKISQIHIQDPNLGSCSLSY